MRDGNVSLRWNKGNYQLVRENSLVLIFFLHNSARGPAPVLYVVSMIFIIVKESDLFQFQVKCHQIGWLVVQRLI